MTMTSTPPDPPAPVTSTGRRPFVWPRPSTSATSTCCGRWRRTTGPGRPMPALGRTGHGRHNLGMAEMAGSLPEMVRQFAARAVARRRASTP